MKILEKKSVEVNFTESLLRMAADDVEGNQKVLYSFLTDIEKLFLQIFLIDKSGSSPPLLSPFPSPPFPLTVSVIVIILKWKWGVGAGGMNPYKIEM